MKWNNISEKPIPFDVDVILKYEDGEVEKWKRNIGRSDFMASFKHGVATQWVYLEDNNNNQKNKCIQK